MLKMSFYDGTLDRDKANEFIATTEKPFKYTVGLRMRNPVICNKPITREKAMEIVATEDWLDITEYANYVHLNTFSSNDLW